MNFETVKDRTLAKWRAERLSRDKTISSAPHAVTFCVHTIHHGIKTPVAFGMTEVEALMLVKSVRKKLERLAEKDGDGKPLFELMPKIYIEKEPSL